MVQIEVLQSVVPILVTAIMAFPISIVIPLVIPIMATIIITTPALPEHSAASVLFYYFYFLVFSQILQK